MSVSICSPSEPIEPRKTKFNIPPPDHQTAPAVGSTSSQNISAICSGKYYEHHEAYKFLSALWRSNRFHQLGTLDRQTKKFKNLHVNDINAAVKRALDLSAGGSDAYLAIAEYQTPNSRTAINASGAFAFWLDIDCGPAKAAAGNGYETTEEALQALDAFCTKSGVPYPTHIVNSGAGLHVYFVLDSFIAHDAWLANAVKFKALTHALNFLADDARTADIASVLRVPGTLNYKYQSPRPVTLLHATDLRIGQTEMFASIDSAYIKFCPRIAVKVASPTWPSSNDGTSSTGGRVFSNAEVRALISHIDPDADHNDWVKVLMAVHHITNGNEEGFDIANQWSSRGSKYKGTREIRSKWRSFKSDRPNRYNIGTIINMVKANGIDWRVVCANTVDEPFLQCDTIVITDGGKA